VFWQKAGLENVLPASLRRRCRLMRNAGLARP